MVVYIKKWNSLWTKEKKSKREKTYDVEASMKSDVNVIFTKMQATRRLNLFGERAVAAMKKELKQLEEVPMPGKKLWLQFILISYLWKTKQSQ